MIIKIGSRSNDFAGDARDGARCAATPSACDAAGDRPGYRTCDGAGYGADTSSTDCAAYGSAHGAADCASDWWRHALTDQGTCNRSAYGPTDRTADATGDTSGDSPHYATYNRADDGTEKLSVWVNKHCGPIIGIEIDILAAADPDRVALEEASARRIVVPRAEV